MFDYTCSHCAKRSVLFPSQVKQLINDDKGIVVIVKCWCGELGAMRTGAKAEAAVPSVPSASAELLHAC